MCFQGRSALLLLLLVLPGTMTDSALGIGAVLAAGPGF